MASSQRPSWTDLVCPAVLSRELRSTQNSDLESRENLKELLFRHYIPENRDAGSQPFLRQILDNLLQDFLVRKNEMLRLDKTRREKIEQTIRRYSGVSASLAEFLSSRAGSEENRGLNLFALEMALFHLAQILLVRRLIEIDAWEADTIDFRRTLHWQLTQYLKKISPKGLVGRSDWGFLKQNCYSWFSPSQNILENTREILESVRSTDFGTSFMPQLMRNLSLEKELFPLGLTEWIPSSQSLWQMLLDLRCQDQCTDTYKELNASVAIVGMRHGEALEGLTAIFGRNIPPLSCFSSSDLEQFFTEMCLLWNSLASLPSLKITRIFDSAAGLAKRDLFSEPKRNRTLANVAAYFPESGEENRESLALCLDQLCENGLLLWPTEKFWPTESDQASEGIRDFALKNSVIRWIIDLRHLSVQGNAKFPRGIFILEKSSSKEVRDSSRPQLLRVRGSATAEEFANLWTVLRNMLKMPVSPGEVVSQSPGNLRIEAMAAASNQGQLRASPWTTLTEPSFFEIIGKLRRSTHKAFNCASVMRWKMPEKEFAPTRGVTFKEIGGKALVATPAPLTQDLESRFLFLPDNLTGEHPLFFSAMINSAPIQFWYRLEHEQDCSAKGQKGAQRKTEQLLKLMPVARVFMSGEIVPVPKETLGFKQLDSAYKEVTAILAKHEKEAADRIAIHEFVIALEKTIMRQTKMVEDYFQHLFPKEKIQRWRLPTNLPEVDPLHAITLFTHLERMPVLQHPLLHPMRLKPLMDFRIGRCELTPLYGNMAELVVSDGHDNILKITGPAFLVQVAHAELQKRIGRPWLDSAVKILLPTDLPLLMAQLGEFKKITETELNLLHKMLKIEDEIFAILFGLSAKDAVVIRNHLYPEEVKPVQFAKPEVRQKAALEAPKGLLQ